MRRTAHLAFRIRPALLAVSLLLPLSACGAGAGAGPTPSTAEVPDGAEIDGLWAEIRADLAAGRDHEVEARTRRLAELQEDRCRHLRDVLQRTPPSERTADDTSPLARCEVQLRQYRAFARLSDFPTRSARQ